MMRGKRELISPRAPVALARYHETFCLKEAEEARFRVAKRHYEEPHEDGGYVDITFLVGL
jgi:hypothetical protein